MPSPYGTNGPDLFQGTNGTDWFYAGEGNDTVYGYGGNDWLLGDNGDDYIDGGEGNDNLWGDEAHDLNATGNDTLDGGSGNDSLFGQSGSDTLFGWSGNDELYGGDGDDRLDGYADEGTEYDTLSGEAGYDTFVLGAVGWGISYLGSGYATITDFNGAYDWLEVLGDSSTQSYNGVSYSLGTGNWEGTSATDTLIYYGSDVIAVVQDTTDVQWGRDFLWV
jgi:Ca2+-binding RTX toxin-like protein